MKSGLARARDKWLVSDDGKKCRRGQTSGIYLQNRLERAFLAGTNFSSRRVRKLEAAINYALVRGIMTEKVCKKLEQALKG